jgi:hypothetical protein
MKEFKGVAVLLYFKAMGSNTISVPKQISITLCKTSLFRSKLKVMLRDYFLPSAETTGAGPSFQFRVSKSLFPYF